MCKTNAEQRNPCGSSVNQPVGSLIAVRTACLDDAQKVHELVSGCMMIYCRNSGIEIDKLDAISETYEDVCSAISTVPFFVAVDSGISIVGSVRLLSKKISSFAVPQLSERLSQNPDEEVSYLSRFAVHEDIQGLGIGSLLYQAAEASARASARSYMLLHTSLSNRSMVSFYKKRGYELLFEDPSRGYPRGLFGKKLT